MKKQDKLVSRERPEVVGRDRELSALRSLIEGGATLLTLFGPAGVGKSALARRLAHELDALWCDVTQAIDGPALERAVATTLGVSLPISDATPSVELVSAALAPRACVLVLDNFEHLTEVGAPSLARWLAAAPEVQIVITSRAIVKLPDERVYELSPLSVPGADADVGDSDAVRLWLERVRARTSDYEMGADAPFVARLVRELDGLPLAIELAAARHSVLGPATLLARIDQRLDLLGPLTVPGSRATALRAAIAVSWSLLEPSLQRAFARCAVFCDGFSLEAAEAVIDDRGALDMIQELRDQSLLQTFAEEAFPGEQRFRLLLSIRAYAAESLSITGDGDAAEARMRDYFVSLAERLAEDLRGASPGRAYQRLASERANLVAVVGRCMSSGRPADAVAAIRMLVALDLQQRLEGPFLGPIASFMGLVELHPGLEPRLHARALSVIANTLVHTGDREAAASTLRRAIDLAASHGLTEIEVQAEVARAGLLVHAGRLREATEASRRALSLARQADPRVLASAEVGALQVYLAARVGERSEVRSAARNAIERLRVAGAVIEERIAARDLAALHCDCESFDEARSVLRPRQPAGDLPGFLGAYLRASHAYASGRTELVAGDADAATRVFEHALELSRAPGDVWLLGASRALWGVARWQLGFREEAASGFGVAISELAAKGLGVAARVATALLAAVTADLGNIQEARARLQSISAEPAPEDTPLLSAAVELALGYLDLAESRSEADASLAAHHRGAAVARLERLEATGSGPDALSFSEIRVLARGFRAALDGTAPNPAAPVPVLRIGPDTRWFELPGGRRIECERRPVMRRLVRALAEARRDAPGRAVEARALVAIGWPGEKIMPAAAKSRVQMMVSRLRELGLRDRLCSTADGYALATSLEVSFAV